MPNPPNASINPVHTTARMMFACSRHQWPSRTRSTNVHRCPRREHPAGAQHLPAARAFGLPEVDLLDESGLIRPRDPPHAAPGDPPKPSRSLTATVSPAHTSAVCAERYANAKHELAGVQGAQPGSEEATAAELRKS